MSWDIFIILVASFLSAVEPNQTSLLSRKVHRFEYEFVTRAKWHARHSKKGFPFKRPVPLVVIHHTAMTKSCYNRAECSAAMREIQDYHMDVIGWQDIAYHFCVGSDGAVYEGRGWDAVSMHAKHINKHSIGIAPIGNWTKITPPKHQVDSAKALIKFGVKLNHVQHNYRLVAHRDLRRHTECPGNALYAEVRTWPNYKPKHQFGPQ